MDDTAILLALCKSQGLTLLGIADANAVGAAKTETAIAAKRYSEWLRNGAHGEMRYLEKHAPLKYHPAGIIPGTKSLLIVALPYYQKMPISSGKAGRVARYAWGRDYHKVLLAKLKKVAAGLQTVWQEDQFRCFTDTAPLDERFWAEHAGGAFSARNTLSISNTIGSWFLIGELFSSRSFAASSQKSHAHGACPSSCRRCTAICPTKALSVDPISGAGIIDARRCISYLTIEYKGSIPEELRPLMGDWIFGCDLCQEVCPFNLKAESTIEPEFLAWKAGPELDLAEILSIKTDAEFTQRFGGSPVHRAGRNGLRRNACIVAANMRRVDLCDNLAMLTKDPDPIVAETALWALRQLGDIPTMHQEKHS